MTSRFYFPDGTDPALGLVVSHKSSTNMTLEANETTKEQQIGKGFWK
jgi:hypothetical protein